MECKLCSGLLKYDCNGNFAPDDEELFECESCGSIYDIDLNLIEFEGNPIESFV